MKSIIKQKKQKEQKQQYPCVFIHKGAIKDENGDYIGGSSWQGVVVGAFSKSCGVILSVPDDFQARRLFATLDCEDFTRPFWQEFDGVVEISN
jgi:hypothetical protein